MTRWALISSERGTESTTAALAVIEQLRRAGLRVEGFVQHKLRDAQGAKRYELERLRTGERRTLAIDGVAAKGPTEEFFCSMAFHNDAFETAARWVREDAPDADLVVLDGISKLEVSGKGHARTLEAVMHELPDTPILLLVRASQLSSVVEQFRLEEDDLMAAVELPVSDDELREFGEALLTSERARRGRGQAEA